MEIVARHKLPSRCLFYGEEFKDIEVEYRAMTTVEQELMIRPGIVTGKQIGRAHV